MALVVAAERGPAAGGIIELERPVEQLAGLFEFPALKVEQSQLVDGVRHAVRVAGLLEKTLSRPGVVRRGGEPAFAHLGPVVVNGLHELDLRPQPRCGAHDQRFRMPGMLEHLHCRALVAMKAVAVVNARELQLQADANGGGGVFAGQPALRQGVCFVEGSA